MKVSGILFDLDGTLVDSERENAQALSQVFAAHFEIEISQDDRNWVVGHSWVEIQEHLRRRYSSYSWGMETLIENVAATKEEILRTYGLQVLPGAVDCIRRFEGKYPLAIVTGSSRRELRHCMESMGISQVSATTIASEDVTEGKPSPMGYLKAARSMQILPEHCLVIEDSAAGIEAGIRAGMGVIAVAEGNFSRQPQDAAHLRIDTLHQLQESLFDHVMVRP